MALYFSEDDVQRQLSVRETVEALEDAFRLWGHGQAVDQPRRRIRLEKGFFHMLEAAIHGLGVHGFKAYTAPPAGGEFLVNLYDSATGKLLALLQGHYLGQIRTGAASGLATRYMARPNASTVGTIGTGFQAETQLEAVCAVRPIKKAKAYSRTSERREAFARKMSERLGIEVEAVDSGQACVEGVDIINVITSSREPVLHGEWLSRGQHINAAGSNHWMRRELDDEAVRRADLIVADSLAAARSECGELIWAVGRGVIRWEQVRELRDIVAGHMPGRPRDDAITLFESQGLAIEDVAAAYHLYQKAGGQASEMPF